MKRQGPSRGLALIDVRHVFRSLQAKNFRLFFAGQLVSMVGMWMQDVGLFWLVLRVTNSALALGVVSALSFGPMLFFGMWGGVIADRFDKRLILLGTQFSMALIAIVLGVMALEGQTPLWAIYLLTLLNGCAFALDNPTRRAFLLEMVGPTDVSNAVSLWTALSAGSRVIGPAIAGLIIATTSVAYCFLANAASYVAVILALLYMNKALLRPNSPPPRTGRPVRAALRYAWSRRAIRVPLIMMAVIGTLAYNFEVLLPLLARFTFHQGPETFGLMVALLSVGYVIGSLLVATRSRVSERYVATCALTFGMLLLAVAASDTLTVTYVALTVMGVAASAFISSSNAIIQVECAPAMSGRVLALFGVLFLGTTPIGGPIVGAIPGALGARTALAVGGLAAATTGLTALAWYRHAGSQRLSDAAERDAERPVLAN